MKRTIGIIIMSALLFAPVAPFESSILFAQESPSVVEQQQEEVIPEISIEENVNPEDLQPSIEAPVVQETFNTQEDADVSLLENNSEDVVVESQPEDSGIKEDDTVSDTEDSTIIEEETPSVETEDLPSDVQQEEQPQDEQLQEETLQEEFDIIEVKKPRPVYTFSFSQKTVPTHKKEIRRIAQTSVAKQPNGKQAKSTPVDTTIVEQVIETQVDTVVTPEINNETGAITLSGACSSKYFVVLVYKNATDYADNAGSYILNKAFTCENGTFSYAINSLPRNLPDGSYYILIGEQGETGTWTPASQLTEITLSRN